MHSSCEALSGIIPANRLVMLHFSAHALPPGHHTYVSGDPSVRAEGTELPFGMRGMRDATVEQVTAAVSALSRSALDQLGRRGPARSLLVRSLVACTPLSKRAIARELRISHRAVNRTESISEADLRRVERVLCDPRFTALMDHDLSQTWTWRRYREARLRKGAYDRLLERAAPRLRRRSLTKRGGLQL